MHVLKQIPPTLCTEFKRWEDKIKMNEIYSFIVYGLQEKKNTHRHTKIAQIHSTVHIENDTW